MLFKAELECFFPPLADEVNGAVMFFPQKGTITSPPG
jgi:hypothetical protein